jgi:glycosyltransferase involved in cell wall biosynthesis
MPPAEPLISIVVAVRNGAAAIDRCLHSIAAQSYPRREAIVIDGASTDGTVEAIARHAERLAFWKSEPDRGIADAWNKGLAAARGDWILFLGADDFLWKPDTLEHAARSLARVDSDIKVAYGRVVLVAPDGIELGMFGEPWERAGPRFREVVSIPHQGTFHRRSLFAQRGSFDPAFALAPDYELLLRELKDGKAAFFADPVIAGMGYGGLTSSPDNAVRCLRDIRRAQRKNGIAWTGPRWLLSTIKAVGRIALFRLLGRRLGGEVVDLARRASGKDRFWTRIQP